MTLPRYPLPGSLRNVPPEDYPRLKEAALKRKAFIDHYFTWCEESGHKPADVWFLQQAFNDQFLKELQQVTSQ